MESEKSVRGIHHITAIAGAAAENVNFYEKVLGLRLVKQTVNFDDPFTYHLYYGDEDGHPGTILTFFPWPGMARGKNGRGMVTGIAFAVPEGAAAYWRKRLLQYNVEPQGNRRFGDEVISFSDPHGLQLELISSGASAAPTSAFANVPPQYAIKGFHSATATVASLERPKEMLTDVLGMTLEKQENMRYRFVMDDDNAQGHIYDLLVDEQAKSGRQGCGSVHHIAFRTAGDQEQLRWQRFLSESGYQVTEVRDRKYFHSIYFHEPAGILFEIATDPPGFSVDEMPAKLGQSLQLPDNYEPLRPDIEKILPPLRGASFIHEYRAAVVARDQSDRTIIALHGSGGDEHDLVPFVQQVSDGAAIISPRGKVVEDGMNRFFARLSSGMFDKKDLIRRTHELADFLMDAAIRYHRPSENFTAVGYSNGANIAAAMLFLRPEIFTRAVLLRPMLPLLQPEPQDLRDTAVLIVRGRTDTVIPHEGTDQLIRKLEGFGAQVEVKEVEAGHGLTPQDMQLVSRWLRREITPRFAP